MALMSQEQQEFYRQINDVFKPLGYWTRQQFEEKGRTVEEVKIQFRRVMAVVGAAREEGKVIIFAPREVKIEQIVNAIIGTFEGGYSPWIHSVERLELPLHVAANHPELASGPWYANETFWQEGGEMRLTYDQPTDEEGAGTGRAKIGLTEIISGIEKMAIHAPKHFADLVEENDDAITHDVMMQFVVLGEIIYG